MTNDEARMTNEARNPKSEIRNRTPGTSSFELRTSDFLRHSSFDIRHSPLSPLPSPFTLLVDPPATGPWNMAVDEALLEAAAADGLCALRFYQWSEPTLSLGYFQAYADRQQHAASVQCPVVRRQSGGGAILHDIELTYSLAVPEGHPLAVNRLQTYRVVHQSLIEALAEWGIEAAICIPDSTPHAPREGGTLTRSVRSTMPQPFLCFQRRSPGDVLIGGVKIAGSAQRRVRGAVLQHGSLLLGRSAAAPELDGLKELSARPVVVEELIEAWLQRFAAEFGMTWRCGSLADVEHRRAGRLAAEKYASATWTNSR
jgi:lipoyl(octanoyl) transferase